MSSDPGEVGAWVQDSGRFATVSENLRKTPTCGPPGYPRNTGGGSDSSPPTVYPVDFALGLPRHDFGCGPSKIGSPLPPPNYPLIFETRPVKGHIRETRSQRGIHYTVHTYRFIHQKIRPTWGRVCFRLFRPGSWDVKMVRGAPRTTSTRSGGRISTV